jgi:hypothetical protein
VVQHPNLISDKAKSKIYPYAVRAATSKWTQGIYGITSTTMQSYLDREEPNTKIPEKAQEAVKVTSKLFDSFKSRTTPIQALSEEFLINLLTEYAVAAGDTFKNIERVDKPLSSSQIKALMGKVLPQIFWEAMAQPGVRSAVVNNKHFSQLIEGICELDRFQCLHQIQRTLANKPIHSGEALTSHETAREKVSGLYEKYLYYMLASGTSTLAETHKAFTNIPGSENIISHQTRNRLQGAWSEVVGLSVFASCLKEAEPEADIEWILAPEELDIQGVDSIILISKDPNAPLECIVAQVKSAKNIKPRDKTLFYAYSNEQRLFGNLICGTMDDAFAMPNKNIRKRVAQIDNDLRNAITPGTEVNNKLVTTISEQQRKSSVRIIFTSILLVVPGDPVYYKNG